MKPLKPLKRVRETHVSNTKMPMGDYYGSGIKQKVGRLRDDYMGTSTTTSNKTGKPPKSLA